MIRKQQVVANGIRMNVLSAGSGPVIVLLHGWPEFAEVWKPLMALLADRFTLIAPDFRGFGESENPHPEPSDAVTADVLAADMKALLDEMGVSERVVIVSHDVGAQASQSFARRWPEAVAGLFFFNCPYHGIGARWAEPDHLKEIWYQSFQQKPWAAELVGASRETVRTYFGAFLRHWAADPHAFDAVLEDWVDNFMRPGNLQGGFNWYIGGNAGRIATMKGEVPKPAVIHAPTQVFWGERDPVCRVEWMDRLPDYFSDLRAEVAPGVGHFVHFEAPSMAAAKIGGFCENLSGWGASRE